MSQQEAIKLFETQKVRTYWDNELAKWHEICSKRYVIIY